MMRLQFLEKVFLEELKVTRAFGYIKSQSFTRYIKCLDVLFPIPGEGPTMKKIEKGFYNLRFYITHTKMVLKQLLKLLEIWTQDTDQLQKC